MTYCCFLWLIRSKADLFFPDIVYNETSSLWACCQSNGGLNDCGNPGKETFYAAAPNDLREISSSSTSSTSSTSSSSQSTTTSRSILASKSSQATPDPAISTTSINNPKSSSTNCSENHTCSSGLSAGARVGIGVGAALGGLAVLVGSIFVFVFIRRSKRYNSVQSVDASNSNPSEYKGQKQSLRAELDGADMVHEAHGRTYVELPVTRHDSPRL